MAVTCLELLAFQRAVLNASSPGPSPGHHHDDDDDEDDDDGNDDDHGDDGECDGQFDDDDQYQSSVLLTIIHDAD